jgi:hypothetical protein
MRETTPKDIPKQENNALRWRASALFDLSLAGMAKTEPKIFSKEKQLLRLDD